MTSVLVGTSVCFVVMGILIALVAYRLGRNANDIAIDKARADGIREGWLDCEGFVLHRAAKESFALHGKVTRWFQWPEGEVSDGDD